VCAYASLDEDAFLKIGGFTAQIEYTLTTSDLQLVRIELLLQRIELLPTSSELRTEFLVL
jgi:hypothetical protein